MTKRNGERGVAVALVMLILALVTLAASGMVLQSRLDTKHNRALSNYDKMFNLADAGAIRAFYQIQLTESVGFSGESVYTTVDTGASATMGQWQSKMAIKGYSTDPQDTPGWGLGQGSGYHMQFWIGEGSGTRAGTGSLAEAIVDVAAMKLSRN
jgi:hypothetical protein